MSRGEESCGGCRRSRAAARARRLGGAALALAAAGCGGVSPGMGVEGASALDVQASDQAPGPLIVVAIDGLHPRYLELDAGGGAAGAPGNWLMPNARRFVDGATWYPGARGHLPSATDMNHLNALAGTSSAQTGVIGVSFQVKGWDAQGQPEVGAINVDELRDDAGRPVDTLFHAWKRRWPGATTAFVSGKGWVAEGYRTDPPVVDHIVTGSDHPAYVRTPLPGSLADPPGDDDAQCDPESARQSELAALMSLAPQQAPHDAWTVHAALRVLAYERPDMTYVLLAQTDDLGHALGAAHAPEEYESWRFYLPPRGCSDDPAYHVVSDRDARVFREAILDGIREVDLQLGRLLRGLAALAPDATVVLLSDHSMVTHLRSRQFSPDGTDYLGLLQGAGLVGDGDVIPYSATSYGALYFRDRSPDIVAAAEQILEAHLASNPETGLLESPWWVLNRDEMRDGLAGVAEPGELYHRYFVDTDQEQTLIWPDLFLLARSGFQVAAYDGMLANLGREIPVEIGAMTPFVGGHGSVDALPIVLAFSVPGGRAQISDAPARISDIAPTLAALYGLELRSTVIGQDRSADLY